MHFRTYVAGTAVLFGLFASSAFADVVRMPLRGKVQAYSSGHLQIVTRDGKSVNVDLAPKAQIVGVVKRSLDSIKVGDYVSSTAVQNPTGSYDALQISIFPAALRGMNEGQKPWDAAPGSVMTNATIDGVATKAGEQAVDLKYGSKTLKLNVSDGTPIVSFIPKDGAILKPGTTVFMIGVKDGTRNVAANLIISELNGVKPPM